ncbi:MAG TPA: type II toxin-antitoxin system RelE/ParE family toxin [Candidatus Paceibacterota bacterium]
MAWQIDLAGSANKFLSRIPKKDTLRINAALQRMAESPYTGDIEKLKGDSVRRRRIGSYRVFFELFESVRVVRVYGIERRGSNTY